MRQQLSRMANDSDEQEESYQLMSLNEVIVLLRRLSRGEMTAAS
jgi:hypothetical protein